MIDNKEQTTVFKLDQIANIRNISNIHSEISSALSSSPALTLDLADVPDVDLSFVQLLESARLQASLEGKQLTLSQPASGTLLDVLRRAGVIETASPEDAQFWLHKGSVQ
ncbi:MULTISPECIES: STAS domain-containing protein [Alphaproteobacteria]|uniref:STAS domain-containing protein n=2 Tax=Alphaproteobacteria TaxID=28211 RepID=A0A512HJA6_9HYPH|nr:MULTISPECIES: STAS domain-containing protein [Alphaproteobacteria]GEO85536.1 hypothetical protein RNA01_24680 [Ciceribacter naphthalenivorans]GLR21442.1 hypothetical protein GCM10007920_12280 [Ciceribacter naphthalenivorans]GLT04298.1 hypothetical protein GCM10007926_12280 [Sphingomonas psychrolutea]